MTNFKDLTYEQVLAMSNQEAKDLHDSLWSEITMLSKIDGWLDIRKIRLRQVGYRAEKTEKELLVEKILLKLKQQGKDLSDLDLFNK